MAKKTNTTINDKKYYRVRAKVGVDENGKNIMKAFYGESKKEAEAKRDDYLEGINRGLEVDYDKITFGKLFYDWLNIVVRPNVSLSTFERYESTFRLAIKKSTFYNSPAIAIKSIELQKFYNIQNESNGPHRVERIHGLLHGFFKYCINEKILISNPASNLKLPKIKSDNTVKKYLSEDEIGKLLSAFNSESSLFIYVFAVYTGMRQGEIFALTHNDIDFKKMVINVNKSFKRVTVIDDDGKRKSELVLNPTKTQSSVRTIPIAEKLVSPIKQKMAEEKEKHLKHGIKYSKNTALLFSSNLCTPLRSDHVTANWMKVLESLDIPYVKFHGLRHTFGTLLAKKGIPLKTASLLMGHTNINTTAQIYIHVDQEQMQNAINSLNDIAF